MKIALSEAKHIGLNLPALELAEKLYAHLKAAGGGRLGTQTLIKQSERMNI